MNTRGRSPGGKTFATATKIATFIVPLPSPWTSRPPISWTMCTDVPDTTRPALKITSPTRSGFAGPIRSLTRPATTVANSIPIRNSENDQA